MQHEHIQAEYKDTWQHEHITKMLVSVDHAYT